MRVRKQMFGRQMFAGSAETMGQSGLRFLGPAKFSPPHLACNLCKHLESVLKKALYLNSLGRLRERGKVTVSLGPPIGTSSK